MHRRLLPFLFAPFLLAHAAEPEVKPGDLPRVPPTPPEKAAATFTVRPGFHVELMVSEPLIASPVAISWDEDGRLYVVEMIDYSERSAEKLSRVKLLEDTDGDGRYDKATVFADGLSWATGVMCWDGGVFVLASQQLLYFKDTDGDKKADVHAIVYTGFGSGIEKLNVQGLPNSLQWGPDQRIHGALGTNASLLKNFARAADKPLELRGRDFSFDPHVLQFRAELGGGQWGMSFDNFGRKFVTSNSRHLVQILYDARAQALSPFLPPPAVDIPVDGPQAEVFRTSPVEPWRVLRTQWRVSGAVKGIVEGGGRASGYFTGASGGVIYRGDAFPAEYSGNAFVADCGSNLIHRKVLRGDVQLIAERAADEQKSEFAASRDNWFRPVSPTNAPDGCLWICDMARETIEHPWSLPESLKTHLDLNSGNDRGRLYRIVPDGAKLRGLPKLGALSSAELVALLAHPNGWHRDTAARLLHQRRDAAAKPALVELASRSPSALGRQVALRVLEGCGWLDADTLAHALADTAAEVRAQALQITASHFAGAPAPGVIEAEFIHLAHDPAPFVRYQLAWTLGQIATNDKISTLLMLAAGAGKDPWMHAAIVASAKDVAGLFFLSCVSSSDAAVASFTNEAAMLVGLQRQPKEIDGVIAFAADSQSPEVWIVPLAEGMTRSGGSLATSESGPTLRPLAQRFERRIRAGQPHNAGEFAVLGAAGFPESAAAIAAGLEAGLPAEFCSPALQALQRLNPADLGAILTKAWPKLPTAPRGHAVRIWRSRPKLIDSLLAALEAGTIAKTDLSAEDVAGLRERKEPAVKARMLALFGPEASREKVVADFQPALALKGDAAKGHATFTARCAICHRIREEGSAVGPDLAAAAVAGREKLLGNILDPSREITAGFATAAVETRTGEIIGGVAIAETDGSVVLRIPGGSMRTFARAEIARLDHSPRSLMPDGLEAGLTPQDMADLLEFLGAK
jgi:putative membrane-bound dehydrogenase-like protein